MQHIFIVRHTQSEANLADRLGGRKDYPLSPQGFKDARSIAREFRDYLGDPIQSIISSPLRRARQTAEQMAQVLGPKDLAIEDLAIDPALTEQAMGKFTGLSYAELEQEPDYQADRSQRWSWMPPASSAWPGESYSQIAQRISRFFARLAAKEAGNSKETSQGNVLIVSHAVTMRLIYAYLFDTFPQYLEKNPQNGEIWQIANPHPDKQKKLVRHFFNGSRSSQA